MGELRWIIMPVSTKQDSSNDRASRWPTPFGPSASKSLSDIVSAKFTHVRRAQPPSGLGDAVLSMWAKVILHLKEGRLRSMPEANLAYGVDGKASVLALSLFDGSQMTAPFSLLGIPSTPTMPAMIVFLSYCKQYLR